MAEINGTNETVKMSGWKTKTGAILTMIGGALLAGAEAVPVNELELAQWLTFAGTIFASAGAGLLGVGLGHKLDKGTAIKLLPILLIPIVMGCALMTPSSNIDPEKGPVCDRLEYRDSLICSQLRSHGVANAEDARDLILDANDVSLILEVYNTQQIDEVLNDWDKVLDLVDTSYAFYLTGVVDDLEKAQRLSNLLKRRFGFLQNLDSSIVMSDRKLLKTLNQRIREQSGLD